MRLRIRALLHALRKPFQRPPSKKKGGGAPTGAPRVPPRRRKESLPAYAARAMFASARIGAGLKRRRARLSALHRGIAPRDLPQLGSGPRFLESPDPNGRTLSGTSAASTSQSGHAPDGRCPKPPGSGCMARPRAPHSLRIREYPREGVPDERAGGAVTVTGTFVTSRLRDRDHKCDDQSRSRQRWKSPCLTGVTGLHFTMERLDLVR